jgi:hypothetical protein
MRVFVDADTIRVAVIGSRESPHYTGTVFLRMCAIVLAQLDKWEIDPMRCILVSGGCSWGDHVAIALARMRLVRGANVHLPGEVTEVPGQRGYPGTYVLNPKSKAGGSVCAKLRELHQSFLRDRSTSTDPELLVDVSRDSFPAFAQSLVAVKKYTFRAQNGFAELLDAVKARLVRVISHGSHDIRNAAIAHNSDCLIALVPVVGADGGPPRSSPTVSGGGTCSTWTKFGAKGRRVCLGLADMGVVVPRGMAEAAGALESMSAAEAAALAATASGTVGQHYTPLRQVAMEDIEEDEEDA